MGGNAVDEEEPESEWGGGAADVKATVVDEVDAVMIDFLSLVIALIELVLGIPILCVACVRPEEDECVGTMPV